jgi:pSer/pThr/pTyr-binding forkhead associated (FHA) protein
MTKCPTCGIDVEDGIARCPKCDMRFEGTTQSFEPVGQAEEDSPVDVEDAEGPVLVVQKGPEVGERFYVDRERLTLGRDPASDIFLNDVTVSRAHAILEVLDGGVRIHDNGSLNGTYVNGSCVGETMLSPGDTVQIGTFHMVFLGGGRGA